MENLIILEIISNDLNDTHDRRLNYSNNNNNSNKNNTNGNNNKNKNNDGIITKNYLT